MKTSHTNQSWDVLLYAVISTRPDIAHAVHQLTLYTRNPRSTTLGTAKRSCSATSALPRPVVSCSLNTTLSTSMVSVRSQRVDTTDSTGRGIPMIVSRPAELCRSSVGILSRGHPSASPSSQPRRVRRSTWRWTTAVQRSHGSGRSCPSSSGIHPSSHPSLLHCDNQSAMAIAKSEKGASARTKHIDVRYHYIKDEINFEGQHIAVQWCPHRISGRTYSPSHSPARHSRCYGHTFTVD